MPHNNIISQRAQVSKDGKVYVPECMRRMLPSTLCAVIEERAGFGKCIAFYLKMHDEKKGRDVVLSDGHLDIMQMCAQAAMEPPFVWRAYTSRQGTLLELLLHQDDQGGCYKAVK